MADLTDERWNEIQAGIRAWEASDETPAGLERFFAEVVEPLRKLKGRGLIHSRELPGTVSYGSYPAKVVIVEVY